MGKRIDTQSKRGNVIFSIDWKERWKEKGKKKDDRETNRPKKYEDWKSMRREREEGGKQIKILMEE